MTTLKTTRHWWKDRNRGKDIQCVLLEELILLKYPFCPKTCTDFCNPYQGFSKLFLVFCFCLFFVFFCRNRKNNVRFIWNQGSWVPKTRVREKKMRGITLPGFKLYNKAVVIKTAALVYKVTYTPMQQIWEPRNKPRLIYDLTRELRKLTGENMLF